jgi:hypothetical protein
MKICCSCRARSETKGISKFFSLDMVNTRIDLQRIEDLLIDSKDDINSIPRLKMNFRGDVRQKNSICTKYQIGKKRKRVFSIEPFFDAPNREIWKPPARLSLNWLLGRMMYWWNQAFRRTYLHH